jgi:magnesium-transporting ATPase (P-type)
MFLFSLKKWFLNYWDNLTLFILLNIISALILCAMITLPFLNQLALFGFTGFVIGETVLVFALNFFSSVSLGLGKRADKADSPKFRDLKDSMKANWRVCALSGVLSALTFLFCVVIIPFYFLAYQESSGENVMAGILTGVLVTLFFFWILVSQFVIPVMLFNKMKFRDAVKEAVILTLDNPGFSVMTSFVSWLVTAVSAVTVFLLPGYVTSAYYVMTSYRLRMYKYAYLNENPGKKVIPWKVLLGQENERLGKRTMRGFFNLE